MAQRGVYTPPELEICCKRDNFRSEATVKHSMVILSIRMDKNSVDEECINILQARKDYFPIPQRGVYTRPELEICCERDNSFLKQQ